MDVQAGRHEMRAPRGVLLSWARVLAVLVVVGGTMVLAPSAQASCPLLHPDCGAGQPPSHGNGGGSGGAIGGIIGGVTDTVGDAVGDVTDTVGDVVGGATDTVGDAVGGVTDTVGDVVGDVTDTVGGVVDGVGDAVGGTADAPPGSGPGGPVEPPASVPLPEPARGRPGIDPPAVGPSRVDRLPASADAPSVTKDLRSPAAPQPAGVSLSDRAGGTVAHPTPHRGLGHTIARAAAAAARHLAFPVALALIVAGFLLIQDRLDRRDPKLSLAPIRPEVATFD